MDPCYPTSLDTSRISIGCGVTGSREAPARFTLGQSLVLRLILQQLVWRHIKLVAEPL